MQQMFGRCCAFLSLSETNPIGMSRLPKTAVCWSASMIGDLSAIRGNRGFREPCPVIPSPETLGLLEISEACHDQSRRISVTRRVVARSRSRAITAS